MVLSWVVGLFPKIQGQVASLLGLMETPLISWMVLTAFSESGFHTSELALQVSQDF